MQIPVDQPSQPLNVQHQAYLQHWPSAVEPLKPTVLKEMTHLNLQAHQHAQKHLVLLEKQSMLLEPVLLQSQVHTLLPEP